MSGSPTDAERLQRLLAALVRRFSLAERADVACCGMTVAQAATLETLRTTGPLRLGPLSELLGISPSTLTRNLARLEERELVARRADPADGRAVQVTLTAAGTATAARLAEQDREFMASVLDHLPPGSERTVLDGLARLMEAIRAATARCCPGAFDHLMEGCDCYDHEA